MFLGRLVFANLVPYFAGVAVINCLLQKYWCSLSRRQTLRRYNPSTMVPSCHGEVPLSFWAFQRYCHKLYGLGARGAPELDYEEVSVSHGAGMRRGDGTSTQPDNDAWLFSVTLSCEVEMGLRSTWLASSPQWPSNSVRPGSEQQGWICSLPMWRTCGWRWRCFASVSLSPFSVCSVGVPNYAIRITIGRTNAEAEINKFIHQRNHMKVIAIGLI